MFISGSFYSNKGDKDSGIATDTDTNERNMLQISLHVTHGFLPKGFHTDLRTLCQEGEVK